jgi:hypothetical protein
MNGETDQTCRMCANLRSEHGKKYCDWLGSYLEHFYQSGTVKRKYLSKDVGKLVERPKEELEARLLEILGQENRSSETSSGVI